MTCDGQTLLMELTDHTLRAPSSDEEWRVYHSIRRKVLFENRGHFGVYNENYPDEFEMVNYPLILIHKGEPIGVIRIDIDGGVAWFRRVAVREELQRAGHGRVLLGLAEAFARSEGCHEVRSNVAADAVGFYERCGYLRDSSKAATSEVVPMQRRLD
jgi:GNAT superfamily N-acetyltransferase